MEKIKKTKVVVALLMVGLLIISSIYMLMLLNVQKSGNTFAVDHTIGQLTLELNASKEIESETYYYNSDDDRLMFKVPGDYGVECYNNGVISGAIEIPLNVRYNSVVYEVEYVTFDYSQTKGITDVIVNASLLQFYIDYWSGSWEQTLQTVSDSRSSVLNVYLTGTTDDYGWEFWMSAENSSYLLGSWEDVHPLNEEIPYWKSGYKKYNIYLADTVTISEGIEGIITDLYYMFADYEDYQELMEQCYPGDPRWYTEGGDYGVELKDTFPTQAQLTEIFYPSSTGPTSTGVVEDIILPSVAIVGMTALLGYVLIDKKRNKKM